MAREYPNTLKDIFELKKNVLLTDGASRGNPGPAGWAYILLSGELNMAEEAHGFSAKDTNNRMEMLGALMGLKRIQQLKLKNEVFLLTDSNFMIDALKKWRHAWKRNDWHKSDKSPVLHSDIWKELNPIFDDIKPKLFHVEAHKGHPANTRCDQIAVAAATQESLKLFSGALNEYKEFSFLCFDQMYPSARYLCWKGSKHLVIENWPEAQKYLKDHPGSICKKIFSPEEIPSILKT